MAGINLPTAQRRTSPLHGQINSVGSDNDDITEASFLRGASKTDGPVTVPDDAAQYARQRQQLAQQPVAEIAPNVAEVKEETMQAAEGIAATGGLNNEDDAMGLDDDLFGEDAGDDEDMQTQLPPMPQSDQTMLPDVGAADIPRADTAELSEAELERRRRLEYDEDGDEGAPLVDPRQSYATLSLAQIPVISNKEKLWHAKLPNFMHLEALPYTKETYRPEDNPTSVPLENTIRWRWHPQQSGKRQANSRIVRWSDGSLSLQIGNEIFDVSTDRSNVTGKAVPPAMPGTSLTNGHVKPEEATTFLVAQHGYAGVLETQAAVTGNMAFRLTSIASQSHRKLASALSAKSSSAAKSKTRMVTVDKDPEAEMAAFEASLKKGSRKKGVKRDGAPGAAVRKGGRGRSMRSTRLDDFSDDDDMEDSAAADDADDPTAAKRVAAAERKRRKEREQAEMDDFLATESEDDEADSDDDDPGRKARSGRRDRAAREEEEAESDDLDAMEKRAERAARKERERKKQKDLAAAPTSQRMPVSADIDSDDLDADESTFTKKKLVVESDEDE